MTIQQLVEYDRKVTRKAPEDLQILFWYLKTLEWAEKVFCIQFQMEKRR